MYTVNETNNVSMICRADSEPHATITWSKTDSGEILAYGEQFQIFNTSKHDDGTYICTARNYLGSDSRKVFLNVQSKFNDGHNFKFIPTEYKTIFPVLSNPWLISSADARPYKTVFDLKQRCFDPIKYIFVTLNSLRYINGGRAIRDVTAVLNTIFQKWTN